MDKILYHGSNMIIENPIFGGGNPRNDYGLGFYCTENLELSKEWSCTNSRGGFSNEYSLSLDCLNVIDLSSPSYSALHWLAVLTENRIFSLTSSLSIQARTYLQDNFLPELSGYDVICGYRADDSYFAFAQDFLRNIISITQLSKALALGNLGKQIVLKTQKAFETITFVKSEPVDGDIYHEKRMRRDAMARHEYTMLAHDVPPLADDIYMIDIIREEMRWTDGCLR